MSRKDDSWRFSRALEIIIGSKGHFRHFRDDLFADVSLSWGNIYQIEKNARRFTSRVIFELKGSLRSQHPATISKRLRANDTREQEFRGCAGFTAGSV